MNSLDAPHTIRNISRQYSGAPSARPRILGIVGSLRSISCSDLAMKHAATLVRARGCEISVFDPKQHALPFCNGDKEDPRHDYPSVRELRQRASNADALILVTPEYHGGMSGVLKNILDLLDIHHLEGKVIGAISVLGGPQNSNALNDLRTVIRWCHGWMLPEQIAIGRSASVLKQGGILDPELLERFESFIDSLIDASSWFRGGLRSAPATHPGTFEQ